MISVRKFSAITAAFSLAALVGCSPEKAADAPAVDDAVAPTSVAAEVAAPSSEEKPFIVQTKDASVSARVVSIDHATRDVVLELENGEQRAFTVGEAARNLDQVAVGDLVTLTFFENITIEVIDGKGVEAGGATLAAAARAEVGEAPGGAMARTDIEVFMVEAIDLEMNTFVLKNAEGQTKEFTAQNPDNLKRAAVGDAVVISITNAVAVDVTKAQAAE